MNSMKNVVATSTGAWGPRCLNLTARAARQEGEVKHHVVGEILVFDDSKVHLAFNHSDGMRTILLFDIARPDECPVGRAAGSTTTELASFIDYFK